MVLKTGISFSLNICINLDWAFSWCNKQCTSIKMFITFKDTSCFHLHFLCRTLFLLFWNFTQHWVIVSYWCVGTAYHSLWGQDQQAVPNCWPLTTNTHCITSHNNTNNNYCFGITTVAFRNKWTLLLVSSLSLISMRNLKLLRKHLSWNPTIHLQCQRHNNNRC
jgi:hypothetical protein